MQDDRADAIMTAVGIDTMLTRILCLFDKHSPKRSSTDWDGVNYIGNCRRCGHRIRRISKGKWKNDQRVTR
jgi:hypothetical protein